MVQKTSSSHTSKSKDMKKRKMWGGAETISAGILLKKDPFNAFRQWLLTNKIPLVAAAPFKWDTDATQEWKTLAHFKKAIFEKITTGGAGAASINLQTVATNKKTLIDADTQARRLTALVPADPAAAAFDAAKRAADEAAAAVDIAAAAAELKKFTDMSTIEPAEVIADGVPGGPRTAVVAESLTKNRFINMIITGAVSDDAPPPDLAANAPTDEKPFKSSYKILPSIIASIAYKPAGPGGAPAVSFSENDIKEAFDIVNKQFVWAPVPEYKEETKEKVVIAGIFNNETFNRQVDADPPARESIDLVSKFNINGQATNYSYVLKSSTDLLSATVGTGGVNLAVRGVSNTIGKSLKDEMKDIIGTVKTTLASLSSNNEIKQKLYPQLVVAKLLGHINKELVGTNLINDNKLFSSNGLINTNGTVVKDVKMFALYYLLKNIDGPAPVAAGPVAAGPAAPQVQAALTATVNALEPNAAIPNFPVYRPILEKIVVQLKYTMLWRQASVLVEIAKTLKDAEITGGKKTATKRPQKGGFQDMDASKIYNAQGLVSDLSKMFESNVITNADSFPSPFSAGGLSSSSEGLSKDFSSAITADIVPKYQAGGSKKKVNRRYSSCGM